MKKQPWLEQLDAQLKRLALPWNYRRRIVAELQEHAADILSERSDAHCDIAAASELLTRRLGEPEHVAATVFERYTKRSFLGRHPAWSFWVLPIPLALHCPA